MSAGAALQTCHLLVLLVAGLKGGRSFEAALDPDYRLAVVIPAHDEESGIAAALASVMAGDLPAENRRVVVVADNCTDETASMARIAGAEVWERRDPDHRGKGHALAWAFARLVNDPTVLGICVVDADCELSANALSSIAVRLADGADLVQLPYTVSNPAQSRQAALRWAGFALFNVVRPRGRDRLGLSCGLLGTGMGVSTALLRRSPWSAFSYAEDREQHMRWVLAGARAVFASEASVISAAVSARSAVDAQEARWESGRAHLAMTLTPRLLLRWLRTGDMRALDAALEPVLMPQSLLLGLSGIAFPAAVALRARGAAQVVTGSMLGQVIYVVGGLRASRAPPEVWRALADVPRFVARRLWVSAGSISTRRPTRWQRTPREAPNVGS